MSLNVEFLYDFASPNTYLVDGALRGIEARTGITFSYVPCLLGGIFKATGNRAPFLVHQNVKPKLRYELLETQRFVAQHGLTKFKFHPKFPVNSLLLMRGAMVAELDGIHDAYFKVANQAMWEEGLQMDDPEVFAQTMTDAGLDGLALLERAQEAEIKQRLADRTAAQVERGVFGVPTFFVGDDMFFGKERLGQVEDAIIAAL